MKTLRILTAIIPVALVASHAMAGGPVYFMSPRPLVT